MVHRNICQNGIDISDVASCVLFCQDKDTLHANEQNIKNKILLEKKSFKKLFILCEPKRKHGKDWDTSPPSCYFSCWVKKGVSLVTPTG